MNRLPYFSWIVVIVMLGTIRPAAAANPTVLSAEYEEQVRPFLQAHCVSCHGDEEAEADLRVDRLTADFLDAGNATHWGEVMSRITSGDMPPEDQPRPDPDEAAAMISWISTQLRQGEIARKTTTERVSFRKLSREEYSNTILDLLGVRYSATNPIGGLPEDSSWQGFERVGSVLTLSPSHVEKHMAAADLILDRALALRPYVPLETFRRTAAEVTARGVLEELKTKGLADQVRAGIAPGKNGANFGFLARTGGEYRVRIQLSGLRPEGQRPPRLRLYSTQLDRVLFEQDIDAPEDQPITVEFSIHVPAGRVNWTGFNAAPINGYPYLEPGANFFSTRPFLRVSERFGAYHKFVGDDGKPLWPLILWDWIEVEGPIEEIWPPLAHQQIFFGGEHAKKDLVYAREILTRFASRAWRRPATPAEIDPLMKLVETNQKLGADFEHAVRSGLLAVLCSHNFIYLVEGSATAPRTTINDRELASRLSYFLWCSTPDERLLFLARDGKLHKPEVLRAEVRRMLKHPHAQRFANSFSRQWLQLQQVGMFTPDSRLYPDYDEYLEESMVGETTAFFQEVLEKNLSVRNFIESDWSMVNERLAEFYGLSGVRGEEFIRVPLAPAHHRGGLLTQASILSMTSDGTRHRPVHRGKWVLDAILGDPPPPPPANVPAIPSDADPQQKKQSLREKLAAHVEDVRCASCHRKIDPLGLAFENYDAIGRWRTEEVVQKGSGDNPQVDASGVLADGRAFNNAAELKKLLVEDLDAFTRALTEKLAIYALRRGMTFADHDALDRIAAAAKEDDYKLHAVIEALVMSEMFQQR